jgi:hypothetical protein
MAARFRLMKPVLRRHVAEATEVALEAVVEAEADPAAEAVAAVVVEAVVEAVGAAEAVAVMVAAIGTAEIAGASNGDSPALVPHLHLRLLRGTSPDLCLGDQFDFHFHIARQSRHLHGRARGRRFAEILAIDGIHRGKIAHVR